MLILIEADTCTCKSLAVKQLNNLYTCVHVHCKMKANIKGFTFMLVQFTYTKCTANTHVQPAVSVYMCMYTMVAEYSLLFQDIITLNWLISILLSSAVTARNYFMAATSKDTDAYVSLPHLLLFIDRCSSYTVNCSFNFPTHLTHLLSIPSPPLPSYMHIHKHM